MPLALRSCETVREAATALKSAGARYIGGGTLAVRAANEGELSIETFVRVTDRHLRRIEVTDTTATLGASVTMAEIARHQALAALAPAARAVGGPAIRNMATVGGNLFAPAPYGDFAVALLALGATVEVDGGTLDMDEFLIVREKLDAIVTAVRLVLPQRDAFRFVKVARVKPKGVSVLSIAARIDRQSDGTVKSARIALGCMAERPIRAKDAEDALVGAKLTENGIAPAVAAVTNGIRPITDPIASSWYRGEVLPVHFRRLLLS
jgi:CO/xanthine dehydrogenase FAD-binding subunit